jgi:hypothetical protein
MSAIVFRYGVDDVKTGDLTMNKTHVPPDQQPVKIGDRGGDEYESLQCSGYESSARPGPGFPFNIFGVIYDNDAETWRMPHPTDDSAGWIRLPVECDVSPRWESPEAIAAFDEWLQDAFSE